MPAQAPIFKVLHYPKIQGDVWQSNAWTEAAFFGALGAAAAGAVACLPLAGLEPGGLAAPQLAHNLWAAIGYELKQIHQGLALHLQPWTFPWQLQLPIWTPLVAAWYAGRWGYRSGHKPGFVQRKGKVIVPNGGMFPAADGVTVGGMTLSRQAETNGILFVAGMGGGKTVPLSSLMRQVWDRGERTLILDGKPEFAASGRNLHGDGAGMPEGWNAPGKPRGRRSHLLSLADKRSAVWAVGEDIACDRSRAKRWASALMAGLKNDEGNEWTKAAGVIIEGAILICIDNFGDKWFLGDFAHTVMGLLKLEPEYLKQVVEHYLPLTASVITAEAPETLAGVIFNLGTALEPLDLMARYDGLKNPKRTISLTRWLKTSDSLIVGSAAPNAEAGRAFACSILELASEMLLFRGDASPDNAEAATWLFLDEFGDAGRCENMSRSGMVKLRSKGVRVVVGIQSLGQVAETYSQQRAENFSSSLATIFYGRLEDVPAQRGSDAIGHVTGDQWVCDFANMPGRYEQNKDFTIIPKGDFGKLGPVYGWRFKKREGRFGKWRLEYVTIAVRLVCSAFGRLTETIISVEGKEEWRQPIESIGLAIGADLKGRIPQTLLDFYEVVETDKQEKKNAQQ